jgi:alkylation response protein AidB-like acyl-CoA dehydrogenase
MEALQPAHLVWIKERRPVITLTPPKTAAVAGGSFLIADALPESCFFPENFSEEQQQIAQMASDFALNDIFPKSDAIEAKDFAVIRHLLEQAAQLGLTAADIPEEYGGLGMDKFASAIILSSIARQGSFAVTFSAHTGIGTQPLVWYGTDEQKKRYLPRIADGTLVAAYALSESGSGSDAVNAKTRAVLSEDGKSYVLNGEKMWITNGGFADLYTVFARCRVTEGKDAGKEKLTAFLIERGTPGFSNGKEEHKLGIRGSSTTPLILNDCRIPVENLLGEVGKGHHIAFNILNVGRYKLGFTAVGGARNTFQTGLKYAQERTAFGKPIAEFGLIQQKLADGATEIFVAEAMCFRTVGMIDAALADVDEKDTREIQKRIEEYAVECSIVKVFSSEMLDRVVDENLQIFGGYGYVEEFPAERAYRDSRINRIFEGTNEINRMIITGRLLKSAMTGGLALMPAMERVMQQVASGPVQLSAQSGSLGGARNLLERIKKLTLYALGVSAQRYLQELATEQEVMGALSDMIAAVFTLESAILRAETISASRTAEEEPIAVMMANLYAETAFGVATKAARMVLARVGMEAGETSVQQLFEHRAADTIGLRRTIAHHVLAAGKYTVT